LNTTSIPLPAIATESKTLIDDTSLKTLEITARRLLSLDKGGGSVEDLEIVRKGLCFRPTTNRGFPIVSRIPDSNLGGVLTSGDSEGGVFLAAGHGPWGISMSVGTGKVMAEMVQGLKTSADVSQLGFS
jgi:glycine/D-amino acid oxidase-like deaminating enzyme